MPCIVSWYLVRVIAIHCVDLNHGLAVCSHVCLSCVILAPKDTLIWGGLALLSHLERKLWQNLFLCQKR